MFALSTRSTAPRRPRDCGRPWIVTTLLAVVVAFGLSTVGPAPASAVPRTSTEPTVETRVTRSGSADVTSGGWQGNVFIDHEQVRTGLRVTTNRTVIQLQLHRRDCRASRCTERLVNAVRQIPGTRWLPDAGGVQVTNLALTLEIREYDVTNNEYRLLSERRRATRVNVRIVATGGRLEHAYTSRSQRYLTVTHGTQQEGALSLRLPGLATTQLTGPGTLHEQTSTTWSR